LHSPLDPTRHFVGVLLHILWTGAWAVGSELVRARWVLRSYVVRYRERWKCAEIDELSKGK
ncbi:hypothetical protein, partial [Corynebacterium auriscanis]|uniref:hypothetical protein n=1 Tax=Corynebacterium auriscanis TaxID=99807 RepID=UPI0024AD92D8